MQHPLKGSGGGAGERCGVRRVCQQAIQFAVAEAG
jgi:hypothetical protein